MQEDFQVTMTPEELEKRLIAIGFDPEQNYEVPADPGGAALMCVTNFIREHGIVNATALT